MLVLKSLGVINGVDVGDWLRAACKSSEVDLEDVRDEDRAKGPCFRRSGAASPPLFSALFCRPMRPIRESPKSVSFKWPF